MAARRLHNVFAPSDLSAPTRSSGRRTHLLDPRAAEGPDDDGQPCDADHRATRTALQGAPRAESRQRQAG